MCFHVDFLEIFKIYRYKSRFVNGDHYSIWKKKENFLSIESKSRDFQKTIQRFRSPIIVNRCWISYR